MNPKKHKQIELMPLPHGGKRENSGRKPITNEHKKYKTKVMRVDERLVEIIEKLKKEINEENHNLILKISNVLDKKES